MKSSSEKVSTLPKVFTLVSQVLSRSNDYESRKKILARIIKGWGSQSVDVRKRLISENLSRKDLIKAEKMILLSAMPDTVEAFNKGQLVSLLPYRSET